MFDQTALDQEDLFFGGFFFLPDRPNYTITIH